VDSGGEPRKSSLGIRKKGTEYAGQELSTYPGALLHKNGLPLSTFLRDSTDNPGQKNASGTAIRGRKEHNIGNWPDIHKKEKCPKQEKYWSGSQGFWPPNEGRCQKKKGGQGGAFENSRNFI